jgi:hypothetical protein
VGEAGQTARPEGSAAPHREPGVYRTCPVSQADEAASSTAGSPTIWRPRGGRRLVGPDAIGQSGPGRSPVDRTLARTEWLLTPRELARTPSLFHAVRSAFLRRLGVRCARSFSKSLLKKRGAPLQDVLRLL